jgi:hypothetical protein
MENKAIISCVVLMVAAGVLNYFKIIDAEQFKAIWSVVGPAALASLGFKQAETAKQLREIKSRMLSAPKE